MIIEQQFLGHDLVAAEIRGFGRRGDDLRPAFRRVVKILNRAAERQFSSQGRYGGGSWKRLAPSTARRKAARGLDPRIMHLSYRLRDSLKGDNADRIQRVNRKSLVFSTSTKYAGFQHKGTRYLPKRPLIQLPKSDRKLIVRTIYQRIMREQGRFDG